MSTNNDAPAATSTEWLKPKDVQREYKIAPSTFWLWVKQEQFPVSRPTAANGLTKSRAVFIRRSDVERFLNSGLSNQPVIQQTA